MGNSCYEKITKLLRFYHNRKNDARSEILLMGGLAHNTTDG